MGDAGMGKEFEDAADVVCRTVNINHLLLMVYGC